MTEEKRLEIEAKLLVPNLDRLRTQLDAVCVRPRLHEYNIRYEDSGNNLMPEDIVLRLRRDRPLDGDSDRVRLTYKAPVPEEKRSAVNKVVFEAETEVADFDTMDLILRRLGYHRAMVYEKYRTTYRVMDTELVLDEMPFGNFVEIEGAPEAIERVIEQLGLQDAERFTESYTGLFERVKSHLNLMFNDLTFENFRDIDVPPYAFSPIVRL